jgi:hypothetical protein
MAVSGLDFSAQVDAWTQKTRDRMTAVFRGSTQEAVQRIQARVPVDTGFTRASVRASKQSMPPLVDGARPEDGKSYAYDPGQVTMVIASAELGETVFIGWTSSYALALEMGHSKQAPAGFVAITAIEWPQIVKGEIAKAQAAVAARPVPQSE